MTYVKHVSIDFWNTLATPNPAYAEARNNSLAKLYDKPTVRVARAYKQVKKRLVHVSEESGEQQYPIAYFDSLDSLLQRKTEPGDRERVLVELSDLFIAAPPTVLEETTDELRKLKSVGITLSVGSNTHLVSGQTIMDTEVLGPEFDFLVFSDAVGFAKPSPNFFLCALVAATLGGTRPITPSEVIHVGDVAKCDYDGPRAFGMQAVQIQDPRSLPTALRAIREEYLL